MQRDNGRRSFFRVLAGLLAVATNPVAASAPVDVRLYGRVRLSLIWCGQFRPTTAVRVWRDGRIIWTGLAADLPPVALSPDPHRKFGLDELEGYIQQFGAARDQALSQVSALLTNLPAMLAAAGIGESRKRRG